MVDHFFKWIYKYEKIQRNHIWFGYFHQSFKKINVFIVSVNVGSQSSCSCLLSNFYSFMMKISTDRQGSYILLKVLLTKHLHNKLITWPLSSHFLSQDLAIYEMLVLWCSSWLSTTFSFFKAKHQIGADTNIRILVLILYYIFCVSYWTIFWSNNPPWRLHCYVSLVSIKEVKCFMRSSHCL